MAKISKIYFLNLERHPDRLVNMRRQLNNLGLESERVEAIDALKADEAELDKYVDVVGPIPRMGPGARACTAGHFKIWERFLETGAPVAFVLEDDIVISRHYPTFMEEASKLSDDVDILNLNRQNSRRELKKLVVSKIASIRRINFVAMRLLGPHYGTAGYMITRAAAEDLVNNVKRTNIPIDHLLFNPNVSGFNRRSRIYQAFPAVIKPDKIRFKTSIQGQVVHGSRNWCNKLTRGYYEINRMPSILLQILLNRAEIRVLFFKD